MKKEEELQLEDFCIFDVKYCSPFCKILQNQINYKLFEPFLDITEEKENLMLNITTSKLNYKKNNSSMHIQSILFYYKFYSFKNI